MKTNNNKKQEDFISKLAIIIENFINSNKEMRIKVLFGLKIILLISVVFSIIYFTFIDPINRIEHRIDNLAEAALLIIFLSTIVTSIFAIVSVALYHIIKFIENLKNF